MKVKLGDLPKPVKQIAFALLKLSNPPFPITDDLELEVVCDINGCAPSPEPEFFLIKVGELRYGVDYREDSWNWWYPEIYSWTTTPELGSANEEPLDYVQGIIARAMYTLLTEGEKSVDVDKVTKLVHQLLLEGMKEELEEFLKQKLPEWMKGHEFYDIETEKMQKITEIHFEKVSFLIVDGIVEIFFDQDMHYTAKAGDKLAAIWWEDDNKYVEIETEFKGIPIKVRIYGDEGVLYTQQDIIEVES